MAGRKRRPTPADLADAARRLADWRSEREIGDRERLKRLGTVQPEEIGDSPTGREWGQSNRKNRRGDWGQSNRKNRRGGSD